MLFDDYIYDVFYKVMLKVMQNSHWHRKFLVDICASAQILTRNFLAPLEALRTTLKPRMKPL